MEFGLVMIPPRNDWIGLTKENSKGERIVSSPQNQAANCYKDLCNELNGGFSIGPEFLNAKGEYTLLEAKVSGERGLEIISWKDYNCENRGISSPERLLDNARKIASRYGVILELVPLPNKPGL